MSFHLSVCPADQCRYSGTLDTSVSVCVYTRHKPNNSPCTSPFNPSSNSTCVDGMCIPTDGQWITDPCAGVTCPPQTQCLSAAPSCVAGTCVASAQPDGTTCTTDSQQSGRCVAGTCESASTLAASRPLCFDGVKDNNEADIDCGGSSLNASQPSCFRCAAGKKCKVSSDCLSGVCKSTKCQTSGSLSVATTTITFGVCAGSCSGSLNLNRDNNNRRLFSIAADCPTPANVLQDFVTVLRIPASQLSVVVQPISGQSTCQVNLTVTESSVATTQQQLSTPLADQIHAYLTIVSSVPQLAPNTTIFYTVSSAPTRVLSQSERFLCSDGSLVGSSDQCPGSGQSASDDSSLGAGYVVLIVLGSVCVVATVLVGFSVLQRKKKQSKTAGFSAHVPNNAPIASANTTTASSL